MNINFNLKEPKAPVSQVRVIITHRNRVYRKNIGITVKTKFWSQSKQKCGDPKADARIKEIRLEFLQYLTEESNEKDINDFLDRLSSKKRLESSDFFTQMELWVNAAVRNYNVRHSVFKIIKDNFPDITYDSVDSLFMEKLLSLFNEKGYSINYQSTIVTNLKCFMSHTRKLKLHSCTAFTDMHLRPEKVDSCYLTEDELQRLWNCHGLDQRDTKVRDMFFIGVYTASRFSDYSRLSKDNIVDNTIRFTQRKTNESVIIPLSPKVRTIMEKYGWKAPDISYLVLNRRIGEVCRMAGIDTPFERTKSKGNRHYTEVIPKWQAVTSHTARRTGATLLYMSGVPMKSCMLITGHKSQSVFLNYVKLTKEENATRLKDNPFFK